MNYTDLKLTDVANGPGIRISLFVSGCHLNCKGCFNKKAQNFSYGKLFTDGILNTILCESEKDRIAGLSLLGGDPFAPENIKEVYNICRAYKYKFPEKTIYCWTGYTIENLLKRTDEYTKRILSFLDILVDGPFILEQKDLRLKLRGSRNQRILDKKDICKLLKEVD